MEGLRWSWLCAPYLVCTAAIVATGLAAALVRGDRVLRLGMIGAATTALPWSLCQALGACSDDPAAATRILRIGQGPVALVGPSLLLVLLGVSGQLERRRWVARIAGAIGVFFLIMAWTTRWIVPGVQRLPSGMFYMSPGPLTGPHISQVVLWLGVGLWIFKRSSPRGELRRTMRLLLGVLVCAAIGSADTLLLYGIWGSYPIAWLPATVAACIAFYLVVWTDLLRPQGLDRGVVVELAAFALAIAATIALALAVGTSAAPVALTTFAAVVWIVVTAIAWGIARSRPVRVAGERALEQFVAKIASQLDAVKLAERLGGLWQKAIGIQLRALWWRDGGALVSAAGGARWPIDDKLAGWLARHGEALAITELGTMRLGAMRAPLEALGAAHGAALIVPLIDRDELVGLVEADYATALREDERGLVAESARATARALTFAALARAAERERETAREVEIADALRRQASVSHDAELGRWSVVVEYRAAARTTGAGWSASELADGRLAVMITEAQAHGVAAALATAAVTGAFAAATAGAGVTLDQLLASLQVGADGVMRGGEPVATFLAIADGDAIEWACAGHPGAAILGAEVTLLAGRGKAALPRDAAVVVASSALRGGDDAAFARALGERSLETRLAPALVEAALRAGDPREDLLAVIVRPRL
ncbi:MAG TPA: GAF domain-containing protein [Kofleriaceae bacterium]|nr:GAF domain-containing protein [Kofleriaceae bacterium]